MKTICKEKDRVGRGNDKLKRESEWGRFEESDRAREKDRGRTKPSEIVWSNREEDLH